MAFEVDPRSVSRDSLKPAPDTGGKTKPKGSLVTGDKCVYPSEVSVMELKKKRELICVEMHRHYYHGIVCTFTT